MTTEEKIFRITEAIAFIIGFVINVGFVIGSAIYCIWHINKFGI